MKRSKIVCLLLLTLCLPLTGIPALCEALSPDEMAQAALAPTLAPPQTVPTQKNAREKMIDGIIALAQQLYEDAGGRPQRAHYAQDIYICKNFTVYLFNETARTYRMAEYPDVPLVIPDNLPREDCSPYTYGIAWKEIAAKDGNPFYPAASFRYEENLSPAENREAARAFLMQAKRGDFFQMAANYYYGVGAHSMVFIADYDPQTDTVRWTDSNMKGEKRNGERYAYVQYDAVREIDWFVDAFCRKKYGATLYRLREDIIIVP